MSSTADQSISAVLATATCTLLGAGLPTSVDAQEVPTRDFNTSILYYGENDGRVQDISVSAIARRLYLDERILSFGVTIDSLTGATPSGAIRQDTAQTFTRPSGNAAYTEAAGELPLDDTFLDTRLALTLNWQQPYGNAGVVNVGASLSKEYDYLHLGVNGKFSKDFNKRNTTLSAGLAYSHDQLDPVGGAPTPLSSMLDVGDLSNRTGNEDKDIVDFVLGLSQVISRNLVVQVSYSYSYADGYLTDPYKILSVVDGTSGDTLTRVPQPGIAGPNRQFLYERRPADRTKNSLYSQAKYYMGGKVLDASYRYMTDDWEIDSHTVDLRYRWPIRADKYIEPHFRYYTQTEAEFYRLSLVDGTPLPAFASADYRLGKFDAITAGLKFGWKTARDNDMSIRVEFYRQSGSVPTSQIIGNQASRDNYPGLDALIVQFGYRF